MCSRLYSALTVALFVAIFSGSTSSRNSCRSEHHHKLRSEKLEKLCRKLTCKEGELCEVYKPCFDKECKSEATCLPIKQSCLDYGCESNQRCELRHVVCIKAPCYPQRECVNVTRTPSVHKGECPRCPKKKFRITCYSDFDCSRHSKCCSSPCGQTCVRRNSHGAPNKPGECPKVGNNTIGICIAACQCDYNCDGSKKCCSNGCGIVCKAPVIH